MSALAALVLLDREATLASGWAPPRLSDFASPAEFAAFSKHPFAMWLVRVPCRLIGWLRRISPSQWPEFDLSGVNMETWLTVVDVTALPEHPPSRELDVLLSQFQSCQDGPEKE